MKWVTREKARVDRIACPWLISRFIDTEPTFLFVPADQVKKAAERDGSSGARIPTRASSRRSRPASTRWPPGSRRWQRTTNHHNIDRKSVV